METSKRSCGDLRRPLERLLAAFAVAGILIQATPQVQAAMQERELLSGESAWKPFENNNSASVETLTALQETLKSESGIALLSEPEYSSLLFAAQMKADDPAALAITGALDLPADFHEERSDEVRAAIVRKAYTPVVREKIARGVEARAEKIIGLVRSRRMDLSQLLAASSQLKAFGDFPMSAEAVGAMKAVHEMEEAVLEEGTMDPAHALADLLKNGISAAGETGGPAVMSGGHSGSPVEPEVEKAKTLKKPSPVDHQDGPSPASKGLSNLPDQEALSSGWLTLSPGHRRVKRLIGDADLGHNSFFSGAASLGAFAIRLGKFGARILHREPKVFVLRDVRGKQYRFRLTPDEVLQALSDPDPKRRLLALKDIWRWYENPLPKPAPAGPASLIARSNDLLLRQVAGKFQEDYWKFAKRVERMAQDDQDISLRIAALKIVLELHDLDESEVVKFRQKFVAEWLRHGPYTMDVSHRDTEVSYGPDIIDAVDDTMYKEGWALDAVMEAIQRGDHLQRRENAVKVLRVAVAKAKTAEDLNTSWASEGRGLLSRAIPLLIRVAENRSLPGGMRADATRALATAGTRVDDRVLRVLAKDADSEVRVGAEYALYKLGKSDRWIQGTIDTLVDEAESRYAYSDEYDGRAPEIVERLEGLLRHVDALERRHPKTEIKIIRGIGVALNGVRHWWHAEEVVRRLEHRLENEENPKVRHVLTEAINNAKDRRGVSRWRPGFAGDL